MTQWAKQLGCDPVEDGIMVVRISDGSSGPNPMRLFWNMRECRWDWCDDLESHGENEDEIEVACGGGPTPVFALAALRARWEGFTVEVAWALGVDIGDRPL
jgi:hypothetical protein